MAETLTKPLLGPGDRSLPIKQGDAPPPDAAGFDLSRTAIFLDIDGTLLDIAASPLEVRVPGSLRGTL